MLSRFLVTVCKMCRSNKENVNCLVFLTLFCINMRCWIKLVSDCIPSWRRVWTPRPHLCCSLLLQFPFSAPPCTFSGPDRLCRLAPAMVYVPLPETTPLLGRFHLLFFQWFLLFIIIPLVLLAFLNWKHNSLVFLLFSVITVRCMKFPLSAVLV